MNKPLAPSSSSDFNAVVATLQKCNRFVVVSHFNPDADAYGATAALTLALRKLGKHVLAVNESGQVARYKSLPIVGEIKDSLPEADYDCVCIVDCGDIKRVGDSFVSKIAHYPHSLNIDHHFSNTRFAGINWVEEQISSTSEMLFYLITGLGVEIDQPIAHALMAGIIGDTGSFRYRSTTAKTFEVASALAAAGAVPADIFSAIYGSPRVEVVRFQAAALSNLELFADGQIAMVCVDAGMFKAHGASLDDADVLVDRARDIAGVRVSVAIRQADDIWRVSLRSKAEQDDVSSIAQKFGGGGHKMAAAFRWRQDLPTLKTQLLDQLNTLFK
jgi:phosphoesterase RecJ-like protein